MAGDTPPPPEPVPPLPPEAAPFQVLGARLEELARSRQAAEQQAEQARKQARRTQMGAGGLLLATVLAFSLAPVTAKNPNSGGSGAASPPR